MKCTSANDATGSSRNPGAGHPTLLDSAGYTGDCGGEGGHTSGLNAVARWASFLGRDRVDAGDLERVRPHLTRGGWSPRLDAELRVARPIVWIDAVWRGSFRGSPC